MNRTQKLLLGAIIAAALLASCYVATERISIERANRTVAIALDYDEAATLATITARPLSSVLADFKALGVTHLALTERSLLETINLGDADLQRNSDFTEISASSPEILARIKRNLDAKMPTVARRSAAGSVPSQQILRPRTGSAALKLGVGYSEEAVAAAAHTKLIPVARPLPDFVATPQAVECSLGEARRTGADIVVFQGATVVGNRDLLDVTADTLQRLGLRWGSIELVPQSGADKLSVKMKSHLIRTHSISDLEMIETPAARGIARFALAVRERNVRLCYVRLMLTASPAIYEDNIAYVKGLVDDIKDDGFTPGAPQLFPDFAPSRPIVAVVFLGIAAGLLWLVQLVFALPLKAFWPLAVVCFVVAAGAGMSGMGLLLQAFGLGAGVVFPTLGLLALRPPIDPPARTPSILRGILTMVLVTAVTAIGGMLIVGSMSSLATMMQVEQYRGIKFATILPLLFVSIIQAARFTNAYRNVRLETGEDSSEWPALREGLHEALSGVIRYWHAAVILVMMAILGVVLLRPGNQPPVKVSGSEMQARSTLERSFGVRPRTKELLGQPALVLSAMLMFAGRRRGVWLGFVVATIGQVSALNTFCHLHTPLMYSLERDFNGVWLGALLGLIAWLGWILGERLVRRVIAPPPVAG